MARRLIVRPSRPEDIPPIAINISRFDKADIIDYGSALQNLGYGLHYSSTCNTITTPEGKPLGMFGVIARGEIASAWMLITEELATTYRIQLAREGRKWANRLSTKYPVLTNLVSVDHEHKWLTWVRFKDIGTFVYNNQKFRKMEKRI